MSEEVYIDTNVFIYSILDEDKIGDAARNIISLIKKGFHKAYISLLTIDEFIWKVYKVIGREEAVTASEKIKNMPNIELINLDNTTLNKMLEIYKSTNLDPRDSIHLAAMQSKEIKTIISQDSDFDKIKDIKRLDFSK